MDLVHQIPQTEFDSSTATRKRIYECEHELWKFTERCDDGHQTQRIGHCCIRYCRKCWTTRFSRYLGKLQAYRPAFARDCKHLILTWPRGSYDKSKKRALEDSKRKFFQILHRRGYKFVAVMCFDYGNPNHEDGTQTNIHIHAAVNMKFPIMHSIVQDAWRRATGNKEAVAKIMQRSTRAVFRYIAKRAAGNLGHKEDLFLADVMSIEQYHELLYGARALIDHIPRVECPSCHQLGAPKVREQWNNKKTRMRVLAQCTRKLQGEYPGKRVTCGHLFVPPKAAFSCIVVSIYHRKKQKPDHKCSVVLEDGQECGAPLRMMLITWWGEVVMSSLDYYEENEHPPPPRKDGDLWNSPTTHLV